MRNKKRFIAMLMAAAMVVSALGGCGSAAGTGESSAPAQTPAAAESQAAESEDAAAPETEAASESTGEVADGYVGSGGTYTMYLRSTFIDWINDLEWYKEAEKRTGVTVEYQKGTSDEFGVYSEIDQMVLSGTLTDCTMVKQDQANVYGAQGAFYDLKPLIAEYAPHIQAYLDENPDYESLVTVMK